MRFTSFLILSLISIQVGAQKPVAVKTAQSKPKLVVGIVVDQMRWDYVNKFKPFFKSQNGFLRFVNEGASCNNNLIPYLPTVTACGHAAVYTGSTPAIHGITGNSWYDNIQQRMVYCVEDASVQSVGIENSGAGKMSPLNVWTTTLGDELKLATNFKSKVFGISIKDRGAIIPAGHSADGAFWYDSKSGSFISSTYYGKALPTWLTNYNNAHIVDSFYKLGWNLSLPNSIYEANCDADQNDYESAPFGKELKGFPYNLSGFVGKDYGKIASTPYGNNLVLDVASQTLINEKMGLDDITDLLAVSFSSPDYIGHSFGPNSWETLDGYIKLDELLAQFFTLLDKQVGKNNYTVFLTADHAVANVPGYMQKHHLPGGVMSDDGVKVELSKLLTTKGINPKVISAISEFNIYYNHNLMDSLQVSQDKLTNIITSYLEAKSYILQVVESRKAAIAPLPQNIRERIVNGYNPQRSGDLVFMTKSGYVGGGNTGTGHGVFYNYDAHIPLLFYGNGIKKGSVNSVNYMTDIAPTISTLLGIQMPSGSIGKPILEVIQ
ncbi:MAG: alkaline phosphatase family protein [Bacteroidetes bacterium]|nr:alkaline phosphatase family protein [Bacteroidota bacterium]